MLLSRSGGGTGDLDRLVVGAVGEVEAAQPIVGCRQPDPGFEVARMQLDGAAEVALGEAEIGGAEVLLAEAEVVVRILAEQPLGHGVERRIARDDGDRAGRRGIGLRGR